MKVKDIIILLQSWDQDQEIDILDLRDDEDDNDEEEKDIRPSRVGLVYLNKEKR